MYQLTVPEPRFMESELDLNDIIQEMHVVATMPDLYHLLVELNAVHSLLGLLSHENSDILLVFFVLAAPFWTVGSKTMHACQ